MSMSLSRARLEAESGGAAIILSLGGPKRSIESLLARESDGVAGAAAVTVFFLFFSLTVDDDDIVARAAATPTAIDTNRAIVDAARARSEGRPNERASEEARDAL